MTWGGSIQAGPQRQLALCGAGYALIEHADDRCWSQEHRTLRCARGPKARRDAHPYRERRERRRRERADVDWPGEAAAWRSERASATYASFAPNAIRSVPLSQPARTMLHCARAGCSSEATKCAVMASKAKHFLGI